MVRLSFLLPLLILGLPLAAQDWPGKYTSPNLTIELKQNPAGGLNGTLTFDGKTYPVTATPAANQLTGSFRAGNDTFPFEAVRTGTQLRFSTGGTDYLLSRESATANPIANPIANPATKLQQTKLGFAFQLPTGWTLRETPEGVLLLPPGVVFTENSNNNSEVYIAGLRNDYEPAGEADTVRQLSQAVSQNGGTGGQRQALTFGRRPGSLYRWDIRNAQTGQPAAFDVYLATEGTNAFVLLAAGEQARIRANDPTIRQILASMTLTAPTAAAAPGGPLADSTPLAQRWLAKLRGKMIRQMWASQGMSFDKRHWLNADGTYRYHSTSMVSVDVSGASALGTGKGENTGRWRIRDINGQVFLEVRYDNGNSAQMRIREEAQNWYLNGDKAFAVEPQ